MADSSSSSLSDALANVSKAATTGSNLKTSTSNDFTAGTSSRGACETLNMLRESISAAAQADQIMCYVSTMNDGAAFTGITDGNGDEIDIYDGEYHIFNLNLSNDDGNTPSRIKMKLQKDANGSITFFEMFMCNGTGDNMTQSEYVKQEFDSTSVTMTAIGRHDQSMHSVDVTGTLNSSGQYTERAIVVKDSGEMGDGSDSWQESTLTQTPGEFAVSGYRYGLQGSDTHGEQCYSAGELLGDDTDSMTDLAMGDGAISYIASGTWQGQEYREPSTGTGTDAWTGDDLAMLSSAEDSEYYSVVSSATLPDIETTPLTISYESTEIWDCSDDVSVGIYDLNAINAETIESACSHYTLGHDWISCYEVFDENGE